MERFTFPANMFLAFTANMLLTFPANVVAAFPAKVLRMFPANVVSAIPANVFLTFPADVALPFQPTLLLHSQVSGQCYFSKQSRFPVNVDLRSQVLSQRSCLCLVFPALVCFAFPALQLGTRRDLETVQSDNDGNCFYPPHPPTHKKQSPERLQA